MPPSLQRKIVVLFLALLAGSYSADGAEIRFKAEARVSGPFVLFCDIADVHNADPQQSEALAKIVLFPSPAVGRSRQVRAADLRQLLQLHKIDDEQYQFTGAKDIRIQAERPQAAPAAPELIASEAEKQTIVVAKFPIAQGEQVREVDVELCEVEKAPPGAVSSTDLAVGQEVTRAFAAGQPLDTRALRKPILVHRGQAVSVVAKAAGVRARTTARALENGTLGDLVLLESVDSQRKYSAIVSGPQQAEVLALGTAVSDSPRRAAVSTISDLTPTQSLGAPVVTTARSRPRSRPLVQPRRSNE